MFPGARKQVKGRVKSSNDTLSEEAGSLRLRASAVGAMSVLLQIGRGMSRQGSPCPGGEGGREREMLLLNFHAHSVFRSSHLIFLYFHVTRRQQEREAAFLPVVISLSPSLTYIYTHSLISGSLYIYFLIRSRSRRQERAATSERRISPVTFAPS